MPTCGLLDVFMGGCLNTYKSLAVLGAMTTSAAASSFGSFGEMADCDAKCCAEKVIFLQFLPAYLIAGLTYRITARDPSLWYSWDSPGAHFYCYQTRWSTPQSRKSPRLQIYVQYYYL